MLFIILLLAGMTNIQFGKLETAKESPPEQCNRAIWNFAKFGEVSRLLQSGNDFFFSFLLACLFV